MFERRYMQIRGTLLKEQLLLVPAKPLLAAKLDTGQV